MQIRNVYIGNSKQWTLILLAVLAVVVFSPTGFATANYFIQPHSVVCDGFTLRIPFLWSLQKINFRDTCANGTMIIKLPATVFGLEDMGSSLTIYASTRKEQGDRTIQIDKIFKLAHPNQTASHID